MYPTLTRMTNASSEERKCGGTFVASRNFERMRPESLQELIKERRRKRKNK